VANQERELRAVAERRIGKRTFEDLAHFGPPARPPATVPIAFRDPLSPTPARRCRPLPQAQIW
jgi:hypothetical protein